MALRKLYIALPLSVITVAALFVGNILIHPKADIPYATISSTHATTQPTTVQPINRGLPTRLKIPSLGIDAAVDYMGLTKTGDMDTPTDLTEVGWYKYGPLPGNAGSAVISGHVIGKHGVSAVFNNLHKLQVGDTFYVTDSSGQSTGFAVQQLRTYAQDEQPNEVFTSTEGSHLNLITCSGDWDPVEHHYLSRLVVFSDKII